MMEPIRLRTESLAEPLGIDVPRPRFSWENSVEERGDAQTAYRILCSRDSAALAAGRGDLWDSGRVEDGRCYEALYGGPALRGSTRYWWKVRVWDGRGKEGPFSPMASFETGLLAPEEWGARWISMKNPRSTSSSVLLVVDSINDNRHVEAKQVWGLYFRRRFGLERIPVRARAYVSGLGYGDLFVNGLRIGDHRLDPGQTDYARTALYAVHDVTPALRPGPNVVHAAVGNGRYLDAYGFGKPRLKARLLFEFADGTRTEIGTDGSWRCSHGPVRNNGIYLGEEYDAREELSGWGESGYDDSSWQDCEVVEGPPLAWQAMAPIRAVQTMRPLGLASPREGTYVFDFGQNFTGVVRLRLRGRRGQEVRLRFSELLHGDGTLNLGTNREAAARDSYVLKGGGEEVFEPRFTYHGFRYAEITGFPGVPSLESVLGIVIHTDVEATGTFLCSEGLVNRIHANILWGQKSNLMSAPTDCPQRGERMGWLGDAQLASEEAVSNFDMAAFYGKYLDDIARSQGSDGSLSDVTPPFWALYPADPAWGSAYVTLAWTVYWHYGDEETLRKHYGGMRKYVEFLHGIAEGHIVRMGKYGDWCPPACMYPKKTPMALTSTWYYYHDTLLLSRIASVLGKKEDQAGYGRRAQEIKDAFNREFLKDGQYATIPMSPIDRTAGQTSQALPLFLDMVPEGQRKKAVEILVRLVVQGFDHHLDTGIVGTRYLFEVLRDAGHAEDAYKVVTQTTYPGWGYMVAEGATTLWERWEKMHGTGMNSHNHIMFGSIDAWFYRTLAGIVPTSPAWKTLRIRPWPVGDLRHAAARMRTVRGDVAVGWERADGSFRLHAEVPCGAEAEIHIPHGKASVLREGDAAVWNAKDGFRPADGILDIRAEADRLVACVLSGSYRFETGTE